MNNKTNELNYMCECCIKTYTTMLKVISRYIYKSLPNKAFFYIYWKKLRNYIKNLVK